MSLANNFITQFLKGILISVLYFEITKLNDTTLYNIIVFTSFYLSMIYGAILANIDENVITSAFLTKTVFTLVDERIRRKEDKQNNNQNSNQDNKEDNKQDKK
jgi:hypothetical protein